MSELGLFMLYWFGGWLLLVVVVGRPTISYIKRNHPKEDTPIMAMLSFYSCWGFTIPMALIYLWLTYEFPKDALKEVKKGHGFYGRGE